MVEELCQKTAKMGAKESNLWEKDEIPTSLHRVGLHKADKNLKNYKRNTKMLKR
jgi:hypothetical protein